MASGNSRHLTRRYKGDHAKHGGGEVPQTLRLRHSPSTTPLRVAVPLPVPGRCFLPPSPPHPSS
eukprot:gene40005-54088_t